jgi:hypothetical protein
VKFGPKGHRLRVLENRVLMRIFGIKWEEVTRGWRRLHKEELHKLYTSPKIIWVLKRRMMRYAGHVALMDKLLSSYGILIGKPERRRPFGRPRRRCEDDIRMLKIKVKLSPCFN